MDTPTGGAWARRSAFVSRPGPVVSGLAWIGALLLVLSAIIHLHLWSQSYQHVPTIGPLFLTQGIAGIVLAIMVSVSRHLVMLISGALFAIGTIGGLLLSVYVGLFGFRDSLSAPYATLSLLFEAVAFAVLAGAAVLTATRAPL
jgi:xanthine/uracil permease